MIILKHQRYHKLNPLKQTHFKHNFILIWSLKGDFINKCSALKKAFILDLQLYSTMQELLLLILPLIQSEVIDISAVYYDI